MTYENGEYAEAGIDYTKIEPFKRAMLEVGKKTLSFPNRRRVYITPDRSFHFDGEIPPSFRQVTEGLGHKNWIAEWMYQNAGTNRTYHDGIAIDSMLMAVNDLKDAFPITYTDEIAAPNSEWFKDERRSQDIAMGFFRECERDGISLLGGESPSLPLLVKHYPVFSGCAVGIIPPLQERVTGEHLRVGDCIIGVTSSGLHSNGSTLVIRRALQLPEKFLTKLPNGRTLGDEALIPTRSYVALIEKLLEAKVALHAIVPGTGSGVSKIAFDRRPFTYRVHSWINNIPPLFLFMRELGVSIQDCLTTFNWGIGEYLFAPEQETDRIITIGEKAGYELLVIGRVEKGERKVIFEPEELLLPPPGE